MNCVRQMVRKLREATRIVSRETKTFDFGTNSARTLDPNFARRNPQLGLWRVRQRTDAQATDAHLCTRAINSDNGDTEGRPVTGSRY